MTPGTDRDVKTTLPLVLSLVCTLLCCNPLVGLPAIILAVQAKNARDMGAIDVARKRARLALIVSIAGIGLGLLGELVWAIRTLG